MTTPIHAPFTGGDPHTGLKEARWVIENGIRNQPRSLQKRIGPSEIGNPCDHCLAARLAGWEKQETTIPWLPFIGTATHIEIENLFIRHENTLNRVHDGTGRRYLTEHSVMVGHINGQEIWGSCDLIDLILGMTIDWKIVGPTTLRTAKNGPSEVYRTQAHLYARGANTAGHRIEHVAIAYLPRNSVSLDAAVWWTEPYDEQIAVDALARADKIATNITALRTLGEDALNTWITNQARASGCWDCARYPDKPAPIQDGLLAGLATK